MGSLKGFLPTPSFVMAKKTKNLKAGVSSETPAFSVSEEGSEPRNSIVASPFFFVREHRDAESEALLTKMIEAMGLKRSEVFVSHEVKDLAVLESQFKKMGSKIMIALGEAAIQLLLGHAAPIHEIRSRIHDKNGMKIVTTFHPAFLLKNPAAKKECWEDLQFAMKTIGWKKA